MECHVGFHLYNAISTNAIDDVVVKLEFKLGDPGSWVADRKVRT